MSNSTHAHDNVSSLSESSTSRSLATSSLSDMRGIHRKAIGTPAMEASSACTVAPPAAHHPMAESVRRKPAGSPQSASSQSPLQFSDLPEVATAIDPQGGSNGATTEARPGPPDPNLPKVMPKHSSSSSPPEVATPSQSDTSTLNARQLSEWQPDVRGPHKSEQKGVHAQEDSHRRLDITEDQSVSSMNGSNTDETPLLVKAARDNQLEIVQTLLANGADVDAYDRQSKRTALMEASLGGHAAIAEFLAAHGCSLDTSDVDKFSALHHAAAKGHVPVANILLNKGTSIEAKGPGNRTPLHVSLAYPEMVTLLLQRGSDVNARDSLQNTPLHTSASIGNAQVCDILVSQKAHLEGRDGNLRTPLQIACEAGYLDVVQLLLRCSKVKRKDPTFQSALFAAIERGDVSVVEALFEKGASFKCLSSKDAYKPAILAAKTGSTSMLDFVISKKCKIKEKDPHEWSALHFAAHYGHAQVVEKLLANDLSFKAVTKQKDTPLILAVKGCHFAASDALLRGRGASSQVKAEDAREQQPLHHAVRGGGLGIVKLLLSHKANVNAENVFGWRPIHTAIAYGHTAIVAQLLEAGASVEEKLGKASVSKKEIPNLVACGYWAEARWPYPESRPLHLASEFPHHGEIAQLIISKGAKIDAACSEGWKPLHHAAFTGNAALTQQLLEHNANVHAATSEGKSPLELAQFRGTSGILPGYGMDFIRVQEILANASLKSRTKTQWKTLLTFGGAKAQDKHDAIKAVTMAEGVIERSRSGLTTLGDATDRLSTGV